MQATPWFAMYGPAGLPADTLAGLERAVAAAVKTPPMLKLGYEAIGSTSAELSAAQR